DLRAQLLSGAKRRTVQLRAFSLSHLDRQLELEWRLTSAAAQRDSSCAFPEPNELRIRSRARGEALRSYVQRLQKIRLACAVLTDNQNQPRLEGEIETRIRPNVAQRNRRDDQPR